MIKYLKKLLSLYGVLPAVCLVVVVFVPFIANLFCSNTNMLDNRALYKKPEAFTRNFASDFEKYYNDTFAGRKKLIKKLVKIKRKLRFDSEAFIFGQDGWMFYDSGKIPDGYTLIDYFGKIHFSNEELQKMADGIEAIVKSYKARGIDYAIVVVPNKENLYAEFMPERLQSERVSDESRMDRAVKYLQTHTSAKIINLKEALENAKKELPLNIYFKRDTHWNNLGAYYGFNEVLKMLNANGYQIPIKNIEASMITLAGKHNTDLDMDDNETSYVVKYREEIEAKCLINEDSGFMQVYEMSKPYSDKTLLMVRDSFGIAAIPYFNKVFKKTIFVHTKYNKKASMDELIQKYQPDIIVEHLVERYFERFLRYNDIYGEKK